MKTIRAIAIGALALTSATALADVSYYELSNMSDPSMNSSSMSASGLDTEPYYTYAVPQDDVNHDVEVPG